MPSLLSLSFLALIYATAPVRSTIVGSQCICLEATNACTQDLRCNLNTTIFPSSSPPYPTPTWVTPNISSLVASTLARAKNGTLSQHPPLDDQGPGQVVPTYGAQFSASMTCANDTHGTMWGRSCSFGYYSTFMTGYASLGFHPLGTEPGTWLTQIIMPVGDDPEGGWFLGGFSPLCIATDAYINIDKVSDNTPVDTWVQEVAGYPFVADTTVVGLRTDNDLRRNGLEMGCHFDCPDIGHKTQVQLDMESLPKVWNLTCKGDTASGAGRVSGRVGVIGCLALGLGLL